MILKPSALALQVSVNPDYLTTRTKLAPKSLGKTKQNKLRVSHGTSMSKQFKIV